MHLLLLKIKGIPSVGKKILHLVISVILTQLFFKYGNTPSATVYTITTILTKELISKDDFITKITPL